MSDCCHQQLAQCTQPALIMVLPSHPGHIHCGSEFYAHISTGTQLVVQRLASRKLLWAAVTEGPRALGFLRGPLLSCPDSLPGSQVLLRDGYVLGGQGASLIAKLMGCPWN